MSDQHPPRQDDSLDPELARRVAAARNDAPAEADWQLSRDRLRARLAQERQAPAQVIAGWRLKGHGRRLVQSLFAAAALIAAAQRSEGDAAFLFTTSAGTSELALVEWKFTESYLTAFDRDPASDAIRISRYGADLADPDSPGAEDDFPAGLRCGVRQRIEPHLHRRRVPSTPG